MNTILKTKVNGNNINMIFSLFNFLRIFNLFISFLNPKFDNNWNN